MVYLELINNTSLRGFAILSLKKRDKSFRLLNIYEMLSRGEVLNKEDLALKYNVSQKTIQRDINELRKYFDEQYLIDSRVRIKYNREEKGYMLIKVQREWLSKEEVLSLCKILLESRAFCKEELDILVDKLLRQSLPNQRKMINEIIQEEHFHYVPLRHNQKLIDKIWSIANYILRKEKIEISYTRQDGLNKNHEILPVSIIFSEFYFYLIAYIDKYRGDYPIIFRVDRISHIKKLNERFRIPYREKFSDGEFRKRVQFMYPGKLEKIKFIYSGDSVEAVLDRLPTANVLKENSDGYTIEAEVYGKGIDMWIKSQGDMIEVL